MWVMLIHAMLTISNHIGIVGSKLCRILISFIALKDHFLILQFPCHFSELAFFNLETQENQISKFISTVYKVKVNQYPMRSLCFICKEIIFICLLAVDFVKSALWGQKSFQQNNFLGFSRVTIIYYTLTGRHVNMINLSDHIFINLSCNTYCSVIYVWQI